MCGVLQVMPMTAKDLVAGVQRCRVYDADQLVAACVALAAEVPPQVRCPYPWEVT